MLHDGMAQPSLLVTFITTGLLFGHLKKKLKAKKTQNSKKKLKLKLKTQKVGTFLIKTFCISLIDI